MNISAGIARRNARREAVAERTVVGVVLLVLLLGAGAFALAFEAGRLTRHEGARPEATPTGFLVPSADSAIPLRLGAVPAIDLGASRPPAPAHAAAETTTTPAETGAATSTGAGAPLVVPSPSSEAPVVTSPPATAPTPAPSHSGGGGTSSHSSTGEESSGGGFDTSG